MAMLGVYRIILTHPKLGITKDLLATRVLPHIIPISVDSNLNMKQFTAYMSLIKEMLAQIEVDQKKKLEQIEALEREKSIIPYAMANQSGSNKPKNIYKPPDTMMDQVMAGYGINNNMNGGLSTNQAPANFNPDIILNSGHSSTINHTKKELTLTQKHEMATRLENDFNLDANNTNSSISNSMSLNNLNNKSLTESLMDRNLADLSLSNNNNNNNMHKPQLSIMPNSVSSNFTSQQNRFQTPNFGSSMNNHSFQPQNVGNQQMGFFGNLALAAPSDFGKSAFPTIAPPPTYNNMKQALNLNSFGNKMSSQNMNMNNNNNNNNNSNKKSALDDLADIFN
jgi:SCY1-like protein 2